MEKSSISDKASIWLSDAEKTRFSGASLAHTLYEFPVNIFLTGELGSGKTTFLQGLASALGIPILTSPTFALEQRYETADGREFLHLDLYRLSPQEAQKLITTTDDHTGIRCIEWADRLPQRPDGAWIDIRITEDGNGRSMDIEFHDVPLPSESDIEKWRNAIKLPPLVRNHCDAVGRAARTLAEMYSERGGIARPAMAERAGKLHDLFRFIDFKPGASHSSYEPTPEELTTWEEWKEKYPGVKRHEQAIALFLSDWGYRALASVVEVHGVYLLGTARREKTEQKLLFYADKRMKSDQIVSLDERYDDFQARYGKKELTKETCIWYNASKHIENELFPGGVPDLRSTVAAISSKGSTRSGGYFR